MQLPVTNHKSDVSTLSKDVEVLTRGLIWPQYKRKVILLGILLVLVFLIQFVFPVHLRLASFYNSYIFRPFQSLRNLVFGIFPFSVGDVLYLLAFLAFIAVIVRWTYFLVRFRTSRHDLAHSGLTTIITLGFIYLLFFVGWGGNYYRPTLTKFWKLSTASQPVKESLIAYDSFLVNRLNTLAPYYRGEPFKRVDHTAKDFFVSMIDSRTRLRNMRVKASLYGYFMQYLGIQGYYNPFTGESQVNSALPEFMLPFVVCHEMAHQSGIAAEDDANLLSYAICTGSTDSAFCYSGYFNLWLYTHSRLKQADSAKAEYFKKQLNTVSLKQLDSLKAIRKEYTSRFSKYISAIYDSYLRFHNQLEGIRSYNRVALSAWAWEQRRGKGPVVIEIP